MTHPTSPSRPAADASEPLHELTVNELIRLHPDTVGVFNHFGVDACCGGAISVSEAALRDGVDLPTLTAELRLAIAEDS